MSRWCFAVFLLPCLWAVIHQLGIIGLSLGEEGWRSWWRFAIGALGYFLLEKTLKRPMWFYVVGHELTHAVSGLLSGARIHSFKAGSKGGEVRLSKTNSFIALSPYIIPFYAVALILLYWGARHFWPRQEVAWVFQILMGAALSFHFSLTISAFHHHQTDLKFLGFFLSGVLILIGNALILGLLGVSLFKKTPTITQYASELAAETIGIWEKGFGFAGEETKKWIH